MGRAIVIRWLLGCATCCAACSEAHGASRSAPQAGDAYMVDEGRDVADAGQGIVDAGRDVADAAQSPQPCDDPSDCVDPGSCERVEGTCVAGACRYPLLADGVPCDDGDRCTHEDVCAAGTCIGSRFACGDSQHFVTISGNDMQTCAISGRGALYC